MIDKIKKELCTGCNACYSICPEDCIEMISDNHGFWYPKVDYDKCIKCRECVKTCPSIIKPDYIGKWEDPKVYAVWSEDVEIRFNSTTGGVFSELANKCIANGGMVTGAIYDENHQVRHYIADDYAGIEKLRQSKYVQSDMGDILEQVKDNLDTGREMIYVGSPCQVAGLLNFLKKPYDNLLTIDFVCRGTNSPKAYKSYLEMLEKNYNSKITKVWFKNKTYGWNRFSTRVDFENGKSYIKDRYNDLYMRGYISEDLYMRPCCFQCKYKQFPRIGDITLADFWGVGNSDAKLDPDKGTSLIMLNSEKGELSFNGINENIFKQKSNIEQGIKGNPAIVRSAIPNPKSDDFLDSLDKHPFDASFKMYAQNVGFMRWKQNIRRKLGRMKRNMLKLVKN